MRGGGCTKYIHITKSTHEAAYKLSSQRKYNITFDNNDYVILS